MAQNPVDLIRSMKQEGLTDAQITEKLLRDGYTHAVIYDTLQLVNNKTQQNYTGEMMADPVNPMSFQPQGINPMPPMGMAQPNFMPPQPAQEQISTEEIESLIEQVINEKWEELEVQVAKVASWKEKTESRITKIEQEISDLKDEFSSLQKAVIGKVGEYDQNVLQVGSQIKAIEKAFSDVLPQFTQNINELNRITKRLKE